MFSFSYSQPSFVLVLYQVMSSSKALHPSRSVHPFLHHVAPISHSLLSIVTPPQSGVSSSPSFCRHLCRGFRGRVAGRVSWGGVVERRSPGNPGYRLSRVAITGRWVRSAPIKVPPLLPFALSGPERLPGLDTPSGELPTTVPLSSSFPYSFSRPSSPCLLPYLSCLSHLLLISFISLSCSFAPILPHVFPPLHHALSVLPTSFSPPPSRPVLPFSCHARPLASWPVWCPSASYLLSGGNERLMTPSGPC